MKLLYDRILSLLIVAIIVASAFVADAQNSPDDPDYVPPEVQALTRTKVYKGKYHTVIDGDSVLVLVMNEIPCFPPLKFKDKAEEDFFWRTVRDVRKALPYAKLICETLTETYEYIETFDTKQERERYLKEMEGAVFDQYKPQLKKFTKGQAQMLVKLIQRETNQSGYDILKAFLGQFRAAFWQGFGRLFGVNLNGAFRPSTDRKDAIIERVASRIEMGLL